jgi:PAS domain S-box-containing protein
MVSEIQVLHIDDEPSVTDLAATFLEREDDRFTVETATSADEGLQVLDDHLPDCIVSDYNMPGMDGLELLRTIRDTHPDLPFILFTGKGSEAVASDAIAAGVTDYIQKQSGSEQYELLANRILNAVEARRQAERADRQEQLMRLTEFAGDTGGFETDIETGDVLLTDGAERIIDPGDDTPLTLETELERFHPGDQEQIRQTIDRAVQTGEQTRGTWRYQPPEGDQRLLEMTFTTASADGDGTTLRGAVHDVTEQRNRKQELAAEQRFIEQALDTLDDLFYVLDTDGSLRRWNDRLPEVTGYADRNLAGVQSTELFAEDGRETIADAIEMVTSGLRVTVEADLLTADGERLPYEFTGAPLTDADGTVTGVVGVGRDLTERKEIEADIDWHRSVIRNTDEGVYVLDADHELQFVDFRAQGTERLSEQRWTGRHLSYLAETGVLSTAEVEWVREGVDRVVAGEADQISIEVEPELPEATEVAELTLRPLDTDTDDDLVLITTRDITAYKQREQEILDLQRQYQTLAENFPNGAVFLVDRNLEYVRARGDGLREVGLSPADVEGKTPHDLFPDDIADETCRYYEDALDGTAATFEQEYGGNRYRIQTVPVRYNDDEITHLMAVSQNITEYAEDRQEVGRQQIS